MKHRPLVSQRSVERTLQAAAQCWNEQDYQQCFDILERARRLEPSNVAILLELGRVRGMRYEYAAAEESFERAVASSGRKRDVLVMAGLHCRNFRRYDLATRYLERAAQEKAASPDTFVKLAELYERSRQLKDASAAVDRALGLDSKCAMALLVRARLDRLEGHPDQSESRLRSFLKESRAEDWSTRVRGWYELGAVLDRQQRYDEAMDAFVAAKQMIRPNAPPHAAILRSVRAHMKEAGEQITADMLHQWGDAAPLSGSPSRRLALLCGHPRSGTTLLEQVLDAHPVSFLRRKRTY